MGFNVPNIFTNVGNPIIDATPMNANFTAIANRFNQVFNVKDYGATGNGTTDDGPSIQNAINAAQTAGGGVVQFPPGTFAISAGITVGGNNVWLRGSGQGATTIQGPNGAAFDLVTIQGSGATPGTISTYSSTCKISDMTIGQDLSGTTGASTSNAALRIAYTIFPTLVNVDLANCGTGLYLTGTVDFQSDRVRVTSSYCSTATAYGVQIDGTTQNASCYFHNVISSFGSFTGTTCYAWHIAGPHLADCSIFACEGNSSTYGIYLNGQGTGPNDLTDFRIRDFVADQNVQPIYLVNIAANSGQLVLDGCYTANSQAGEVGIVLNTCSGIVVQASEVLSTGYSSAQGIALVSSVGCVVEQNILKGQFGNGIVVSGGSDNAICDNILYATSGAGNIAVATTAPRTNISRNIVKAISPTVWRYGIDVGTGAANCVATGNVFDPAAIFDASSYFIIDATAGATLQTANNVPYNPLGGSVTQPTVGTSPWTYTNNTGVLVVLFVSGGTVSSISAGGVATGLTSGAFPVPAGSTLVLTYSAAPTVTALGN